MLTKVSITRDEKSIYALLVIQSFVGIGLILLNHWTYNYPGIWYLKPNWLLVAPLILALNIFSLYVRNQSPRVSQVIFFLTLYYLIVLSCTLMGTGIQFTPFSPIDLWLVKMDHFLGIDTPAIIAWTANHPTIKAVLNTAYFSLNIQLFSLPFALILLEDYARVYRYLKAMLLTFLIGALCYYFFPTTAPVSVFHSTYFSNFEQATYLKFYQIHHYLAPTTDQGGMVAFPSFHVVWAVLLTHLVWKQRWLFYPVLLLNSLVILSTVLLGWHYFMDVVGGILLAFLALIFC